MKNMKKLKRWMYSKILLQMLTVLLMVSIFTPLTAYTMAMEPPLPTAEPPLPTAEPMATEGGGTLLLGPTGESGEPAIDGEALPNDELMTESPEFVPTDALETLVPAEALGDITLLSGWVDEDPVFFTKIRLITIDNKGKAIRGVVYGLYRTDNNMFVEYLTTNEDGIAISKDLPVNTDYYLKEFIVPTGWQRNGERKDIRLAGICAPSRVDVTAQYDPAYGTIKVLKTGENGEKLAGVGFRVYDGSSGNQVGVIHTNENGEAEITVPYGDYRLFEFEPLAGYAGNGNYYACITTHGEVKILPITNHLAKGHAYLHKYGNDDKNIAGAVFSVFSTSGDIWIEDIATGANGYAYTRDLLLGQYYLVEKSVPQPYVADMATKYPFVITSHGQSFFFNIQNPVQGKSGLLTVLKTDDSGKPLSGVIFGVYRAWDKKKLYDLTTGTDGRASTPQPLIPGDYYLVETAGKAGYQWHVGEIPFTVDGSGNPITLPVINPKIPVFGKVRVNKTDDAGTPLDGVRFGVYCEYDNLLEELTTVDGTALSGILNEGNYYLRELSGAPGHLTNDTSHPFSITVNGDVVTVEVVNPRITGYVKILKTGVDGKRLSQVVFGVYEAGTGTKICELTTGEDGTATSEALYYGEYELRELATVEGYERITTPIPFSISEQDMVLEIPVSNVLIMGSVKLVKIEGGIAVGEAPKYLPGALFGLYNSLDQKLAELTTDEKGEAVYSGLLKGEYFLKELVAPEGYILDDTPHPFAVDEQGEVVEVVAVNTLGVGTVEVYFRHRDDHRELAPMKALTAKIGTDYVAWMRENGYENMPLEGYRLVSTDYPDSLVLVDGTLIVTLWYEEATVDDDESGGGIVVPKTGDAPSYLNYALALVLWGLAGLCFQIAFQKKNRRREESH